MEIAARRGQLIEKAIVEQQAGFLLTALRSRCMAATSAWSRQLLNIGDHREMSERLRELMTALLEDISSLPQQVTDPNLEADGGNGVPLAEDDRGQAGGASV